VDADRFLRELPRLFDDFPQSEHPRDRRFARIVSDVENLAKENNFALLNLAASCLDDGETYVEVGVFHGASLVAAMLGNEHRRFVGVDSFEFRDATLDVVERNLTAFGLPRPELLVGDVFELVPAGALNDARVGVWYMDDYVAEQPRARRILTVDGKDRGNPQWWEGMQVLRWEG